MAKWYHTILPPGTWLYQKAFDFYFYNIKDVRGKLKKEIAETPSPLKVNLGSGLHHYDGWMATDYPFFDVTNKEQWDFLFENHPADNFLSEHVFEHLTYIQVEAAIAHAYRHLKTGGCFRIAVPDGFHSSKEYIEWSKPGKISDDHKIFWDFGSLSQLLLRHGYRVELLEYYSQDGVFHSTPFNFDNGPMFRSRTHNCKYVGVLDGKRVEIPEYSSLIIDAYKI
ncbi:MAG: hypothetical protein NTX03_00215 [Bacteroidetes bacterium]|nr:hypothetical protein [Bacteroidota bacterium]